MEIGRKTKSIVRFDKENAYVMTTRGEFFIDKSDISKIKNYTWWITKKGYVYTKEYFCGKSKTLYLSRYLLDINNELEVDHIDRNKLNNKRSNLRIADRVTNNANKGKSTKYANNYKNVKKTENGWISSILVNGKSINIGTYTSEIAAANAYNYYSTLYIGEFAFHNECEVLPNWMDYRLKHGNKTIYQGVTKRKDVKNGKAWQVHIRINGKRKCIGHFENELEAAKFYNIEAIKLRFELPRLNFIDGEIYGLTEEVLNNYLYTILS